MPAALKRRVLLLCLALCLSNLAGFIVIGHLTSYGDGQGLSSTLSATLISTLLGVALLAMTALQWLGTLVLFSAQGLGSILIGAVLMGLGFCGYLPSYPVIMRGMFPNHQAGRRSSEVYFLVVMTAGLGSWLGGYLRDFTGNYSISSCLAALSSGIALVVLGMSNRLRSLGIS